MKRIVVIIFVVLLGLSATAQSKTGNKLPSVNVKTLDGKTFNTSEISNDGKPILIAFWALWCKPCKKELDAYNELYEDWQDETGVKIIAVSIDDARSTAKVKPFVMGKDWQFDVFLDPNQEFKRAMSVNMVPHTFLLDGNGEIVWNTPITIAGGISAWTQILSIEKDEENGFYIAWYEDRDQDNKFEIYIQHLNANGEITFAENGMEICTNTTQNHFQPSLQVFGSYVIAAWEETDANQNQRGLFAQKISADGTLLWGENGLAIIPLSNENLSFISNKKIEKSL